MGSKRTIIKKSQGFEAWFFVLVVLLAVSLFLIVLNFTWSEVKPELLGGLNSSIPAGETAVNISKTLNQTTDAGLLYDKLLPFLIIGLFAFVMIVAGSIMKHPIMIFVGLIVFGVLITLAVVYSNLYHSITDTSALSAIASSMPIQDKFMRYLPTIIFIAAIAVAGGIIWGRKGGGGAGY